MRDSTEGVALPNIGLSFPYPLGERAEGSVALALLRDTWPGEGVWQLSESSAP